MNSTAEAIICEIDRRIGFGRSQKVEEELGSIMLWIEKNYGKNSAPSDADPIGGLSDVDMDGHG